MVLRQLRSGAQQEELVRRDDEVDRDVIGPLTVLVEPVDPASRRPKARRHPIRDLPEEEVSQRRGEDRDRLGSAGLRRVETARPGLNGHAMLDQSVERQALQFTEHVGRHIQLPAFVDAVADVVEERIHAGGGHVGMRCQVRGSVEQAVRPKPAGRAIEEIVRGAEVGVEVAPELFSVKSGVEQAATEEE